MSDIATFNPSDDYIKALLSKAVYEGIDVGYDFSNLNDKEFSVAERNFLSQNFEVIDSYSDISTGFKACWFQKKGTNEVVYAIAGTDDFPGGLFDYGDDYDICKRGMATEQFIEAYNYYMQVANAQGSIINQIVEGKPEQGGYLKIPTSIPGIYDYYTVVETINTHEGKGYSNITLTGHSLGGHLAGLIGMIKGKQTTIFNAPSYFKDPVGDYSIEYVFIDSEGKETTETLTSDYIGFVEKFFGSDVNQNTITHIYNSNNINIIANLGWNWKKNKGVDCLNQNPGLREAHSINSLCDAYYTYEVIKNYVTNSEAFFENVSGTNSQIVFENIYKLYCLETKQNFSEIDYSSSSFRNQYISNLKNWLDEKTEAQVNVFSDVFNSSASQMTGTDGADIFYTGGGNDTVNSGAGNDVVYGIDLKAPGEIELLPDNGTKNINLGSGSDTYHGGEGNDIVDGGQGVDSDKDTNQIYLGNGTNYYTGGAGNDNVTGGNGRDVIYGGDGKNYIDAGGGNNEMHGGNGYNNFKGGSGNDEIWSYNTTDTISLGGGNNTIHLENNKEVDWFSRGKIYVSAIPETVDTIYGYDMWYREIVCINGGARKVYEIGNDRIFEYEAGNKVILKDVVEKPDPEPGTGTGSGRPSTPLPPDTGVGDVGEIGDELEENFETAETTRSPLVVDLNGDGVIGTTSVADGVYFDHENDGFAEKTGWISAEDGVLVRDLNGNGLIDNGTELFGNSTILSNNETAANGFEALKELDSNGDGFDYISDSSGNSIIEFDEGITLENLTFERSNANDSSKGRDLCVFVNGNRNQGVQIYNFFGSSSSSYRNYTLKFSDGSTFVPKDNGLALALPEGQTVLDGYSYADILTGNSQDNTINGNNGDDVLIGGKGNDTLRGESGNDTYVWNIGDGFDYISDSSGNNIIQFGEGITLENLTFERSNTNASTKGNDLYIFVNGDRNQGMHVYNFFGSYNNFTLKFVDGTTQALSTNLPLSQLPEVNLTLNGTADDDILTGGNGHDIINAGDGYNDITGGQGNDTITGGYDRDTYYYNLGDGFDTVTDPNGKDQIIFGEGISKDDLKFRRNGNDLWLIINNDLTQGMKLVNFFASDDNKIETLKFADNSSINLATAGLILDQWDTDDNITGTPYDDVIYGNDGRDTLSGGSGKDILIGSHGNDTLYGGAGNDTYRWNSGDGFDTIEDNSGQNSVEFGDGINFDDLTFTKIGENLYITVNNNPAEGLNLSKFFNSDSYKNFTLKFKDGTQHALNENGLTFRQGDTFDTINGTNFNDVIYANDGNDTVNALAGNDTVYGGKGNDVIDAGNGDDTLVGGEGNDTLAGGVGDDTYIYNLGDGFDTISDTDGTDKIVLGTGITADMLSFSREGNDLRIIINNDKLQGFLLKNQFAAGTSKIESIEFADESTLSLINKGFTFNQNNIDETITGTAYDDVINAQEGNDTVNAGEGDDIIIGGLGNDNLNGGNGDDTYIYNMGDGFDTITETSGADKIVLGNGIALENLRFIREGNNLRILINNNVDQGFLLVNQFASADTRIEQLQFADNSVLDLVNDSLTFEQYNGGETINGTDNDDTIYGRGGNDTIDAGDGDDTIVGGIGDDTLSGGYGRDTYIYNLGDGADTINETRGNDIIKFGEGISQSDLTFTQEGNNLKIWIGNDPYQSILINNFYSNVNNQVEKLQFADGSTFNLSTQGITLQQTNADDTVNGTSYNDVIYGNGGHDTINAGDGNDTIVGGIGNDILNGENGDDAYVYNLGDGFDTISESGGNDKIVFGEGINQSDLSFEKIGNNLKISINGDEIKGIQINNHFRYDDSKVETIEFHDGSTLDISNADQLIQAMNSFSISNSASMDTLSNPTENVSDMYSLAASQDLTRKAS